MQLTKGAGRIGGLSVSADGRRLILWRANSFPQVFLAEIDAETGRFKTPRRLSLDDSTNQVYAWTPDSRAVLFSSNRSGTNKLYRQAIDQAVPEVLVEGRGMFLARLNPDGTQILFVDGFNAVDPALPQHILSVPLQGGTPRVVLQMAVHPQHPMRTESVETLPLRFSGRFHSALFHLRSGGRKNSRVRYLKGEGGA